MSLGNCLALHDARQDIDSPLSDVVAWFVERHADDEWVRFGTGTPLSMRLPECYFKLGRFRQTGRSFTQACRNAGVGIP
ncbi:hypothetical protein BHF78_07455 [Corynebacterium diphtheriae]|nr:hypothetical protein BHF78_07455 [Corynebacterium diphtheriae]OIR78146.1 hypothetical protein BHF83_02800 [Corynebacterium diphtheriae]OIR83824.1 hypothetical protein BHF87_05100 [Corynebacterium diphtheriae]OIR96389.1 hypothetical protein BHF89_03475 [Corynebacterium diphtheriae]OIR99646.1 hypothetical protein BHF90_07670 [Corynebacterium diphtheriae]